VVVKCVCFSQSLYELISRRKRLNDIEVRFYIRKLVLVLMHLHSNLVIHRDVKPSNLFLSERMDLKLGDFALAAKLGFPYERKYTVCGTANFTAPEIISNPENGHSFEVDIWSVGVIIYTLLVGHTPFEAPDLKVLSFFF
jgi:polo-like kinase 1